MVSSPVGMCSYYLFANWVIFHDFFLSADFFSKTTFLKIHSGIPSDCQTAWIQIRANIANCLQGLSAEDISSK